VAAAIACGVLGVTSVAAAAHGSSNDRVAKKAAITILWIGDTTGPLKVYGDVQLAGVRGAAAYFNSHGGIAGHKVKVKAVSDNADPAIAASVLTQQLASGTPTMVWPGSYATDSGALIPLLARRKVFAISLVDGQAQCRANASVVCPNQWSLVVPSNIAPQAAVNWFKRHGFTKVGLLEATTTYSAAETPEFLKAAAKSGIAVKVASYPTSTLDLTPELQALKEDGAQAIFSEGIGTAQYVYTARANLAWDVPLVFDSASSTLDFTKLTAPANLKNSYETMAFEVNARNVVKGLSTMIKWAGRYGAVTSIPLTVVSTGWDAVVTLNAAVTTAGGSLSVADLNAAMLRIPAKDPLRTQTHKLGWTKDNHQNVLGSVEDYAVVHVGPLVNGRVQSP
jgi:ABC-type branched-subunit amino acid transport system substrate-binding protein